MKIRPELIGNILVSMTLIAIVLASPLAAGASEDPIAIQAGDLIEGFLSEDDRSQYYDVTLENPGTLDVSVRAETGLNIRLYLRLGNSVLA